IFMGEKPLHGVDPRVFFGTLPPPLIDRLTANLDVRQRRVRSRLLPPVKSLRTFGPWIPGSHACSGRTPNGASGVHARLCPEPLRDAASTGVLYRPDPSRG